MKGTQLDSILARVFPGESLDSLTHRRGQFHEVIIGAEAVVSFARTESAALRMPQRALNLDIAQHLLPDVCIPKVLVSTHDYLVMARVPGSPLEHPRDLSADKIPSVTEAIANLLQSFMKVNVADYALASLKRQHSDRWLEFKKEVEGSLFPLMSDAGRTRAREELEAASSISHRATNLVHGDLGGDNLHWMQEGNALVLAAVLDWDELHIGDIATDLAALHATFGESIIHNVTIRLNIDTDTLSRVDAIRGTFALQQALAGYRDGDKESMNDGLRDYL